MVSLYDIRRLFSGEIRLGEPLAHHTGLGIGGPADFFVRPPSREDLERIVTYFRHTGIPFIVIGAGSSILASDAGFRGAVICLDRPSGELQIAAGKSGVYADAGVRLAALVDFCIGQGLQGVEGFAGRRGTVGGMAATEGGDTANGDLPGAISMLELLRDDMVVQLDRTTPGALTAQGADPGRDVILAASFRVRPGNREQLMRARRELLIRRNALTPLNLPKAGTLFRDPAGTSAAALLREAGVGERVQGDALLSGQYPGLVINRGRATAADILDLMRSVQKLVRARCGVSLEPAVHLLGFDEDALKDVA